jgi:hypothetical protein
MTEAEWLDCTDPTPMLDFVRGRTSDRKLRLFAVACCRLISAGAPEPTKLAIATNELFADRQATEGELGRARSAAHNAGRQARYQLVSEPLTPDGGVVSQRLTERPGVSEEYLRGCTSSLSWRTCPQD